MQGLGMSEQLICKTSKAPGKTLTSVKYQQRAHSCVYISSASFWNILQETIFKKIESQKHMPHGVIPVCWNLRDRVLATDGNHLLLPAQCQLSENELQNSCKDWAKLSSLLLTPWACFIHTVEIFWSCFDSLSKKLDETYLHTYIPLAVLDFFFLLISGPCKLYGGMGRCLSGWRHLLLLQRTWIQVPASTSRSS